MRPSPTAPSERRPNDSRGWRERSRRGSGTARRRRYRDAVQGAKGSACARLCAAGPSDRMRRARALDEMSTLHACPPACTIAIRRAAGPSRQSAWRSRSSSAARTATRKRGGGGVGPGAAVQLIGRFDTRDATGPKCGWPGCRTVAQFAGTRVSVWLRESAFVALAPAPLRPRRATARRRIVDRGAHGGR